MPGNSDLTSMLGAPELAAPEPAAPVAPQTSAAPPPALPAEPDASLLARAAVAEGDQNNPESWRNIAGVILNRAQKSGQSVASVLSQPGQFEAYGNGHIQAVDPNSPAYKAALQTVQGVKPGDVPYDSFYQPQIVAQRGSTPPFAPNQGTKIGTQLFGTTGYTGASPAGPQLASVLGLSPEEQKTLAPYEGPEATSAAAAQAGTGKHITFGPNFAPMSAAAEQTFEKIDQARGGIDPSLDQGDPRFPYYIPPGSVAPQTAGAHWVDINGVEHVNPGGAGQNALAAVKGFGQGLGADTLASINRLTGGGFAGGDPTYAAFGQSQGGPSAYDMAQAATQGFQQQQRDYALAHHGDPYAQGGRFFGQAVPAIAASAAVPEVEVPAALGGKVAATGVTNALRGVAATAPSVGTNSAPVLQQLATGAVAGEVAPIVTEIAGKSAGALTGSGRVVSPDVAALADTAKTKYGIDLASGQVMGANGDRQAATAYSNMSGSNAQVYARNAVQRQKWMQGVTNTYGDPSGDISPAALSANRQQIGGAIGAAADRVGTIDASAVPERLDGIAANASQDIGFSGVDQLNNLITKIKGAIGPDGAMPATAYKDITDQASPLMTAVQAGQHPYANQIKNALDDALEGSADPADVADLRTNRWKYKNLMTVAKAAQNQNNIGVDGVLAPNALNTATTSNFKGRAFQGAGDLDELNAIRNKLMTEPPNSFTADRSNDLLHGLRNATLGGLATEGALALASHPEQVIPSALVGIGGATAKAVGAALKANKVGGSAANIVARSLPNAPGPISALSGLKGLSKSVEVPLSALAGVRGVGALQPVGAQ